MASVTTSNPPAIRFEKITQPVSAGYQSMVYQLQSQSLVYEGSWGQRNAGNHASTMQLFWFHGDARSGRGLIEWDVPSLDDTEHIGVWTEDGHLVDYDGISGFIPAAGVALLQAHGIVVGRDFLPD